MVRATFTIISFALILAGSGVAYAVSPDSQAAREFATQKIGVCCFFGMKNLDVIPDKLADANRENADLARQLAASKAANADLAQQLAASKAANQVGAGNPLK